ncbi:hypothetical protein BGX28_000492 [Mortierella sp. GBA30]|nr:hypothetical protein BGX28_000492 [Mortierella sp. GBA30]
MPITDANDPASHCLGLNQPLHTSFDYAFPSNLKIKSTSIETSGRSPNPPNEDLPYEKALDFLFSEAKQDPSAVELCQDIELSMHPPVEAGVLQFLLRLEAIGRIKDWPLLFGKGNTFILYLLNKMMKDEFPIDSENERMIWDLRRQETAEWYEQKRR